MAKMRIGKVGKQRNRSGAKKRFKKTGKGLFAHKSAAHNHLLQQKSKKSKRRAGKSVIVDSTFRKTMQRMLPN
ncbi:MAG: 50S ribosomal protein L35 [Candidatus Peregrinibacteria bacterium]